MTLFRTPWLPEQLFAFNKLNLMRTALYAEHQPHLVDEYLALFAEPGAISGALNWYRAANLADTGDPEVTLPVLFVWGNQDPAVGRAGVDAQQPYLKGDYTELELDAGHWLMETHAPLIVPAVLAHMDKHPSR
jgi:pimeloyl-ACP methyl ester carboxylesterase